MAYGTPTDPVAGTVITVAYAVANLLDPIRSLRAFTGGSDPPGSNYWLRSTSTSAVSWVARATEVLAALGFTPVNKAGDTMTSDLQVNRTGLGAATTGYLILGNNTAYYVGFDGAKHVISTPQLDVTADLYVYRNASGGTTGYIVLGNNSAHFIGFDGTNIVTETGKVWTAGNDGAASGLDADLLDGSQGSAYLARGNHTGTQAPATISPQGSGSGLDADTLDGAQLAALPTLAGGGDFTTAPTINSAAFARIDSGTYSGNGGAGRSIAVAFTPKLVVLTWATTGSGNVATAFIISTSTGTTVMHGTFATVNSVGVIDSNTVLGTNSFVVNGSGGLGTTNFTNVSGVDYRWVAFG